MNRIVFAKKVTPSFIPLIQGVIYAKYGYIEGLVAILITLVICYNLTVEKEIYGGKKEYFLYSLFVSLLLIVCMVCIYYIPDYAIGFRLGWVFITMIFVIKYVERLEEQKSKLEQSAIKK
jgi:membrane-associated HD superfamily phosphohydrolase